MKILSWLSTENMFSNALSSLAKESDCEKYIADAGAIGIIIDNSMEINPWWKKHAPNDLRIASSPFAKLGLFLTFICKQQIEESFGAGRDLREALAALMVFGQDIWPIYDVWVLGRNSKRKKTSYQRVLEWLAGPNCKMVLDEIGLAGLFSKLRAYVADAQTRDDSTLSKWHSAGFSTFYLNVKKEIESLEEVRDDEKGKTGVKFESLTLTFEDFKEVVLNFLLLTSPIV